MDQDGSPSGRRVGFTRRRFLKGASALALTPLVPAMVGAIGTTTRPAVRAASILPLSTGYIENSDAWPDPGAPPWGREGVFGLGRVVPVSSLARGESTLIGQLAVIRIQGLFP